MSQLDLFGNAIPVEEVDWPASLRYLSTIERERGIKLDAAEAGALIHHRRGKHDAEQRCQYCAVDGADALDRLRNRRPLEGTASPATDGTSSRLTDTSGPVSSSGSSPVSPAAGASPRARSTDPQTSHDAAASVQNVTELQERILELLAEGTHTDVSLAAAYAVRHDWPPATPSGLRTRRHELVEAGRVIQVGIACERRGGRSHIVWGLASGRGPVDDPEPEL